jgi:arylsulfatase A-like enzyme
VANLDPKDPLRVDYQGPLDDEPTGRTHPELLKMKPSHGHDMTIVNGISRIGYMSGGRAAWWNDETMADTLTNRAAAFVDQNAGRPFFLYFATHDIHVPRSPDRRFSNATPMGPRGNVIAELDWCAGKLARALAQRGLLENTLLIFSSDNGGVVDDGYQDEAVAKLGSHRPCGPLRGGKYSNFEGGTRVPFIVHWPARVKPGVSDALVSHTDMLRSLAALTGGDLAPGAGRDSENVLPALAGESRPGRRYLVEQAGDLSLRDGTWKYIAPGSGPKIQRDTNTEMGTDSGPQLYDLAADIGEMKNLAAQQPERVAEMSQKLREISK